MKRCIASLALALVAVGGAAATSAPQGDSGAQVARGCTNC